MPMSRIAAAGAGLMLFALPFFQSGLGESHAHGPGPHMDHSPRHGGTLVMVGDYHLEVVEGTQTLEVYVSDAERRPLRPLAARVTFDDGAPHELAWSGYRIVAARPQRYAWADYRIVLDNHEPLTVRLPGAVAATPTPSS